MKGLLLIILVCFSIPAVLAQNAAARYEIDAKRLGVNTYDKDALPRSREFLRLDSTYYVGHYYEGMYKFDRAADHLGYKNCIAPLRRALNLFERDFKASLNAGEYNMRQADIRAICTALYDAWSNIEQADSAMWILEKVKSWNPTTDFMEYHIKSAWTIHRNRYSIGKFAFLKKTVMENEQMALDHLYAALAEGNTTANFYLAIIHNYLQNIDSTEYYYDYLMRNGGMSYNNYAHYKNTLGQFGLAIENFEKDKFAFDKRLIEAYYFLPTLYINSDNSLEAIRQTNEIIAQNGSTPGFGWYNIALSRSYLYNGQLDSSQRAIEKAAQFKELHLGTTLGQAQYDFAVTVIKLMLVDQKMARIKFFNKGWWYSLKDLSKLSELMGEKFLLRYAIVNQFATNPERQNVIYSLFSSENVIGFDEIFNMIKGISPPYFAKYYHEKITSEKRPNLKRYMEFFYGSFLQAKGDENESRKVLENLLNNVLLDTAHEKLLMARLYENLAKEYEEDGDNDKRNNMMAYYYHVYPQLIPFSGLKVKMKLVTSGLDDKATSKVLGDLDDCNINWVSDPSAMVVAVHFEKKKDKYEVTYSVKNSSTALIPENRILFKDAKGVGGELAMRLFGVSGPLEISQ